MYDIYNLAKENAKEDEDNKDWFTVEKTNELNVLKLLNLEDEFKSKNIREIWFRISIIHDICIEINIDTVTFFLNGNFKYVKRDISQIKKIIIKDNLLIIYDDNLLFNIIEIFQFDNQKEEITNNINKLKLLITI